MVNAVNPIGVYDSGIGGLSVLRELRNLLPNEHFIYYADNKNLPYGNKSAAELLTFLTNILNWFAIQKAKMVVAACHTSSAFLLQHAIAQQYSFPIIDAITPVMPSLLPGDEMRLLILATPTSIASNMHGIQLMKHGFMGKIMPVACPMFVPLIESIPRDVNLLRQEAQKYITEDMRQWCNTVFYGCTHYPFIESIIRDILPYAEHINPATAIAKKCKVQQGISWNTVSNGKVELFCSGAAELLNQQIDNMGYQFAFQQRDIHLT